MKSILSLNESASGQFINAEKSSITFSQKAPTSPKDRVKDGLQIQKEDGTGMHLGLPEYFEGRKRDMFTSIVARIKIKAKGWSNK